MSIYIDRKYLLLISPRLDNFKQKDQDLYNFRCPYCGDSQKNKNRARAFIFKKSNDYYFRCHNCSESHTFYNFLSFLDSSLSKEYAMERFVQGEQKNHNYPKPEFKKVTATFKKKEIELPTIKDLPETHPAKSYILSRKIPKGFYKDIYYAEDFKAFIETFHPKCDKSLKENDSRIIFPFKDEQGKIKMLQGRSINNSAIRYISIKLDENFPKLFGLDRLDKTKPINIVEGPIDSFFIKNAIATADSNLEFALKYLESPIQKILIPDIQPRNTHIVNNISKWIKNDYTICLLPTTLPGKDINELIQHGFTKPKLEKLIEEYTFSGLRAKLEFQKWKQI